MARLMLEQLEGRDMPSAFLPGPPVIVGSDHLVANGGHLLQVRIDGHVALSILEKPNHNGSSTAVMLQYHPVAGLTMSTTPTMEHGRMFWHVDFGVFSIDVPWQRGVSRVGYLPGRHQ